MKIQTILHLTQQVLLIVTNPVCQHAHSNAKIIVVAHVLKSVVQVVKVLVMTLALVLVAKAVKALV